MEAKRRWSDRGSRGRAVLWRSEGRSKTRLLKDLKARDFLGEKAHSLSICRSSIFPRFSRVKFRSLPGADGRTKHHFKTTGRGELKATPREEDGFGFAALDSGRPPVGRERPTVGKDVLPPVVGPWSQVFDMPNEIQVGNSVGRSHPRPPRNRTANRGMNLPESKAPTARVAPMEAGGGTV